MNVGYGKNNHFLFKPEEDNLVCPVCNSDIYGSKYGHDFYCVNKECVLHDLTASKFIGKMQHIMMDL